MQCGLQQTRRRRTKSLNPTRHRGASGPLGLWQETLPKLKRVVGALGYGPDAADDILQDVYLTAMRHPTVPTEREGLRRWLFRVTINRCHDEGRRRTRQGKALLRLVDRLRRRPAAPPAGELAVRGEQRQAVRSALASLDESLRVPMVLRYFQDMSSKEIAEILEIPDGTVRGQLRRARLQLADALRQEGHGDD